MLNRQATFFCRADKLGDPFEGSVPIRHHMRKYREMASQTSDIVRDSKLLREAGEDFRKYVYVNCWHINEGESAALWKLYLKSDEGIAIRSTRNRLGESFMESDFPICTVPILYIDYEKDDPPVPTRLAPFRYKRKSFEHERELRAVYYAEAIDKSGKKQDPLGEAGIYVPTNVTTLIERIYVSPLSPRWFGQVVIQTLQKYKFTIPVQVSEMTHPNPWFA